MTFRVTQFAIENQAIRFAARHNSNLFTAQQQISSGLRFVRPSEEPIPFRQVSSLGLQFSRLNVELSTIQSTESILNNSVSQLVAARDLITSASTAVQSGIQSTDDGDRIAFAAEIEGVLTQFQAISNTIFDGEFIYGGTKTGGPPFSFGAPSVDGRSIDVAYNGSLNNGEVRVGESLFVDNYYNGLTIFGSNQREATTLTGETGAQPGSGTDTLSSRANLTVTHGITSFTGASGLAAGVSSPESDNIIGFHQLTIVDTSGDGSSGTISLNSGAEIPFNNTQTDLEIEGPSGERIYVDTTSIAPGFSGTLQVTSTGFLSVDGGASTTQINFSSNQVVNDSITGGFVTIDSTNITQPGTDYLDFPGTSNAFEVLHNIVDDLRNTRGLSATEVAQALDDRLGELELVSDKILGAIGSQSTSLRTLEGVGFRKENLSLQIQTQASEIQGTDFSQAALQLANSQALLEYTFAVTAQINSISILDFLR